MKRLVIFDLDGTLLNTIADLGKACNYALGEMGFPVHELDSYPFMVGNGVMRLIERALPAGNRGKATVDAVSKYFFDFYGCHCMDMTRPYHGVEELLDNLVAQGVMVAVASNKYQDAVTMLIGHYFPTIDWTAVEGQRDSRPTKPCPQVVFDIMEKAGVAAGDVLYVGDSGVDIDTARNAGVEMVGVTWGFRPEKELIEHNAIHIVHDASEIMGLI